MSFMRGLKRFGKGLGNAFMDVGSTLAPMAGMALGGMYGGPMGAMMGQQLGSGLGGEMQRHRFGGRHTQQNPNQYMPGQQQFGNVPMGQMGYAMGEHFMNQNPNSPMKQALGMAGGMMANNYLNKYLSPEMQQMQYGQMPQYMQNRAFQGGMNQIDRMMPPQQREHMQGQINNMMMPQQGPSSFYGSQGQPMNQAQQNQQAFAQLPFAGGYAHGGHVDGYHTGGYIPHYAEGGGLGLRELASLIQDATGGLEGGVAPQY